MNARQESSTTSFIFCLPELQSKKNQQPVPCQSVRGRRSGHRNDPPLIPNQTGGIGETARRRGVEVSRLARQALRPSSGHVQAVSGVKLPWRLPTPKCQQRQAAIPSFSRFANGFELLISQLVNTVCSGVSVYSFSRHLHSHPLPSSCFYFILVGPVVDGVLVVFFLCNCLSCPACRHCCTSPIFTISVALFCLRSASLRLSDQFFFAVVSYQK